MKTVRLKTVLVCSLLLLSGFFPQTSFARPQSSAASSEGALAAAFAEAPFEAPDSQGQKGESFDVFIPIGKYFSQGDAEKLSAWFADNLEISIFDKTSSASKAQARQILKYFFSFHAPRSFTFTHTAEKGRMKYALGTFSAGGEQLSVTFFVSEKDGSYQIQQLKIERPQ